MNYQPKIIFPHIDYEYDQEYRRIKQEMESLYAWWIDCHTNRTDDDWLLDKTFEEYRKVLYNMYQAEEYPSVLTKTEHGSTLVTPQYKDPDKHCDYLFAHAKLEDMHEDFINKQLIRIIQLRRWMWT